MSVSYLRLMQRGCRWVQAPHDASLLNGAYTGTAPQEYHAKAASNGGASGGFSFDVNGRSTLLPIPAALQTRLVRQATGGCLGALQPFLSALVLP